MATVNIPWFTGAPVGGVSPYMGKAMRQRRQLQALTQGLYDVGSFLRKERSQGLPPGATDADLEREEQQLEYQLGESQAKVRDDTTHGVERATKEGDHRSAEAIKNDPAGYAAGTDEDQGILPKLGNFMKTGLSRLMFGDPKRQERLSHISRMKADLAREKDKQNFFKTAGQVCMKSDDPEACLRAAGGGRYGITKLPRITPRTTQAGEVSEDLPIEPKGVGGGIQQRMDMRQAEDDVRRAHGGHMPEPEVARREIRERYDEIGASRERKKADDREAREKRTFDYKRTRMELERAQSDSRRAAAQREAQGGATVTETLQWWKGPDGRNYQMDDMEAERFNHAHPDHKVVKNRVMIRRKVPDQPADESPEQSTEKPTGPAWVDPGQQFKEFGAPNFYEKVD